ncbi:flavodoxin [Desulfovibrio inopinatus]|uniref:flavodoxin n=1 Tax=Desulfovibrio inopinatus TaxID=102109 RepID=UPI000412C3D3|nr:flavodoxin [Desulfovibrio inopinatus]
MKKALIVYGSSTGNTQRAAEFVQAALQERGLDVDIDNVINRGVDVFEEPYDLFCLGVSTWGAIEDEVQEDFLPFYEDMVGLSLSGKRVAVFGCGDSGYTSFCKGVDAVDDQARDCGATLVAESLKIDGDPTGEEARIVAWVQKAVSAL